MKRLLLRLFLTLPLVMVSFSCFAATEDYGEKREDERVDDRPPETIIDRLKRQFEERDSAVGRCGPLPTPRNENTVEPRAHD